MKRGATGEHVNAAWNATLGERRSDMVLYALDLDEFGYQVRADVADNLLDNLGRRADETDGFEHTDLSTRAFGCAP